MDFPQSWQKLNKEGLLHLLGKYRRDNDLSTIVFDSLSNAILVCDKENKLTLVNKTASRLFPLLADGFKKNTFLWDVLPEESLAEHIKTTLLKEDKIDSAEYIWHQDETEGKDHNPDKILRYSLLPLVQDQKVEGSILSFSDISAIKQIERKLERSEHLASLTTVSAGLAHEIKNPLYALSLQLDLTERRVLAAQKKDNIEDIDFSAILHGISIIEDESARLNTLVGDYLSAVKPVQLQRKSHNIVALIREVQELTKPEMEQNKVILDCICEQKEYYLLFDFSSMKQVLLNLVKNALNALKAKDDQRALSSKRIIIRIYEENQFLCIDIIDNGIGISEEQMKHIFTPYFTSRKEGTGLGLTVSSKIIHEHGGEIIAKSKENEGSLMRIILPYQHQSGQLLEWQG